jgi:hypothetical protein
MITSLPGLLATVLPTSVGVVLGLFAEPVRAWILRRGELRIARSEIYYELAGYVAGMERVKNNKVDFESAKRHCTLRPQFDVMDWYKANRLTYYSDLIPRAACAPSTIRYRSCTSMPTPRATPCSVCLDWFSSWSQITMGSLTESYCANVSPKRTLSTTPLSRERSSNAPPESVPAQSRLGD